MASSPLVQHARPFARRALDPAPYPILPRLPPARSSPCDYSTPIRTPRFTIKRMSAEERHRVVLDLAIESLCKSGNLRLRVYGASMLPTIRPGTCLVVQQTTPDQVSTGDVVLVITPAGLRLHRVVGIRQDQTFVTRGDNHRHNDRPVSAADVLAKWHGVITSEPEPAQAERSVVRGFLRKLCA